jgi:hypothetical protein
MVNGVLMYLISPILTFLHELGHAICVLILTNDIVDIRIGNFENKHVSFKIGRLEVYLNKFSPWVGSTNWSELPQEKYKKILICLGGPIASALVGVIFLLLVSITENILKIFLGSFLLGSIVQFLSTIIPMTYKHGPYKGRKSDGFYAIQAIKEMNS